MHARPRPCTVTLLRPPETNWDAFGEQELRSLKNESHDTDIYNEYLDTWMDEYRQRIAAIADDLNIRSAIRECQLFTEEKVLGKKTQRFLEETDVLTTVDPPDFLCAYLRGLLQQHPHMRTVFAYSTGERLENTWEILGVTKTPVFKEVENDTRTGIIRMLDREVRLLYVPRMFAFHYRSEDRMDQAVAQALKYPDCETVQ